MTDRHGWDSWEQYQNAHTKRIADIQFFVEVDATEYVLAEEVLWEGTLYCLGRIEIHLFKRMETEWLAGRLQVRTSKYSYHVLQRTAFGIRDLFRYDNFHERKDHPDGHHKHTFDPEGRETVIHVGVDGWPTLGEVIDEAIAHWERYAPNVSGGRP